MFETVIVPLDGSPHAEGAIPYAIEEARRHQATMVMVHVIPRPEPCTNQMRRSGPLPWQGEWPAEEIATATREARAYLQEVVSRFALDPGTRVSIAVGDPGVRIAAEAARYPRPLVVMLTGDRTREAHPPLSLVASYLLIAGTIPVLGIGQPSTPIADAGNSPGARARLTRPGPALVPPALPPVTTSQG
jgi:nucleotide-binding universal stress UspA family protein